MAQKVNILLVDDLDGSEASETITFGMDGVTYEIDLNDDNATALRDFVEKYTAVARRTGGRSTRKGAAASSSGTSDKSAVREWAKANGMEVSERGRISAEVQEAYDAAQRATSSTTNGKTNNRGGKRRTATVTDDGKVEAGK